MLEIQGLRNKVNNIEKELKEIGALSLKDSFAIIQARTAIIKVEIMLDILDKDLQEIREIRKEKGE